MCSRGQPLSNDELAVVLTVGQQHSASELVNKPLPQQLGLSKDSLKPSEDYRAKNLHPRSVIPSVGRLILLEAKMHLDENGSVSIV